MSSLKLDSWLLSRPASVLVGRDGCLSLLAPLRRGTSPHHCTHACGMRKVFPLLLVNGALDHENHQDLLLSWSFDLCPEVEFALYVLESIEPYLWVLGV